MLTEKRSSQSENQKFAILTNELQRRLQMMDDWISTEEHIEKIDHFTQQLINSGYQWGQIREIIVSSIKGFLKKEMRKKEKEEGRRYRRGDETLENRLRKKLIENVQWYKEDNSKKNEDMDEHAEKFEVDNQKWKPWRRRKRQRNSQRQKIMSRENEKERESGDNIDTEREKEYVRGVFFVPHTENSELAKRMRCKLKAFEEISSIRVKLVERTGEKLVDIIHKSNPWEGVHCQRDDCIFCNNSNEKLIGKCKKRNIVYETECMLCGREEEEREEEKRRECKGADMPSSQYSLKHGMVNGIIVLDEENKENATNYDKEEERRRRDGSGADMPSGQYRLKHGVVKDIIEIGREEEEKNGADMPSSQYSKNYGMVKENKKKRKVSECKDDDRQTKEVVATPVKYIGETSRSAYERLREHYKDFENLSTKSHMIKHYIECHRDIKKEEMRFNVKVLKTFRSAFERQIGESVYINFNLKNGSKLLNSKNEYNRCIIPRIGVNLKDEIIEEFEENEKEKELKREIQKMKDIMRDQKAMQKRKKLKLETNRENKERKNSDERQVKNAKKKEKEMTTVKSERKKREKTEGKLFEMKKKTKHKILIKKIKSQNKDRVNEKLKSVLDCEDKEKINWSRKKERWRLFSERVKEKEIEEIKNAVIDLIPVRKASIESRAVNVTKSPIVSNNSVNKENENEIEVVGGITAVVSTVNDDNTSDNNVYGCNIKHYDTPSQFNSQVTENVVSSSDPPNTNDSSVDKLMHEANVVTAAGQFDTGVVREEKALCAPVRPEKSIVDSSLDQGCSLFTDDIVPPAKVSDEILLMHSDAGQIDARTARKDASLCSLVQPEKTLKMMPIDPYYGPCKKSESIKTISNKTNKNENEQQNQQKTTKTRTKTTKTKTKLNDENDSSVHDDNELVIVEGQYDVSTHSTLKDSEIVSLMSDRCMSDKTDEQTEYRCLGARPKIKCKKPAKRKV